MARTRSEDGCRVLRKSSRFLVGKQFPDRSESCCAVVHSPYSRSVVAADAMVYDIKWIIPKLRNSSRLWNIASSITFAAVGIFSKIIIGKIYLSDQIRVGLFEHWRQLTAITNISINRYFILLLAFRSRIIDIADNDGGVRASGFPHATRICILTRDNIARRNKWEYVIENI